MFVGVLVAIGALTVPALHEEYVINQFQTELLGSVSKSEFGGLKISVQIKSDEQSQLVGKCIRKIQNAQRFSYLKENQTLELELRGSNILNLQFLTNINANYLDLSNTKVKSLEPLQGSSLSRLICLNCTELDHNTIPTKNLKHLSLSGSPVTNLGFLEDSGLEILSIQDSSISDLSPLSKLPLRMLSLPHSNVSDLSPLSTTRLQALDLNYSMVTNVQPLDGLPLTHLSLRNTPLSMLTGLDKVQLQYIDLSNTSVYSLSGLNTISIRGISLIDTPISDWEQLFHMNDLSLLSVSSNFSNEMATRLMNAKPKLEIRSVH